VARHDDHRGKWSGTRGHVDVGGDPVARRAFVGDVLDAEPVVFDRDEPLHLDGSADVRQTTDESEDRLPHVDLPALGVSPGAESSDCLPAPRQLSVADRVEVRRELRQRRARLLLRRRERDREPDAKNRREGGANHGAILCAGWCDLFIGTPADAP
jgi:hypothetical protein